MRYRADKPNKGTFEDLESMTLEQKLANLKDNSIWKCMNRKEVLDEHSESWTTNGLKDLNYEVINTRYITEYCVRILVDVKLNNHWSDLACGIDDTQLDESVDSLRARFLALAAKR
jgi:hypothetical protein